jgi:hypothetical protein
MRIIIPFLLLFLMGFLSYPEVIAGQVALQEKDSSTIKDCEIKDINDVLSGLFHNNKKQKNVVTQAEVNIKKEDEISLLLLPTFSANPTNGVMLGATGTLSWYSGPKTSTLLSSSTARIVYTTKSQLMTYVKSNIYTKNDKFFLEGDWRFYLYTLPTYGLGTSAPDTTFVPNFDFNEVDHAGGGGGYPMDYNFVIFHQIVNRKIIDNLYVGLGYHLETYWNIRDNLLNLDTIPIQATPHWVYSNQFGFDSSAYTNSGVSINFMFDSRDNLINAYKGYYFKLNYRMNPTFLGSSRDNTELFFEFKTYVGLSKKIPRHLIAFWLWGNFQMSGRMPYYALMSLGDDQKATSGRGYIAGRFRGENILYGEMEYRFPILKCVQTLGGVIFVNATTASSDLKGEKLFDYVRPAAGVGLRILVNKDVRLNLTIDYAIGWNSQGIYFGSPDAF